MRPIGACNGDDDGGEIDRPAGSNRVTLLQ
jgi:hypothetical protein